MIDVQFDNLSKVLMGKALNQNIEMQIDGYGQIDHFCEVVQPDVRLY